MGSIMLCLFLILSNVCIGILVIYCLNEIFVGQFTKKKYLILFEIFVIVCISVIYIETFKSDFLESIILQMFTVIIYISIHYEELLLKKIMEALILINLFLTVIGTFDGSKVIVDLSRKIAVMWSISIVEIIVGVALALCRRYKFNLNNSELAVIINSTVVIIVVIISQNISFVMNEINQSFGFILCVLLIVIVFQIVVGNICTTYQKKVNQWLTELSYEQNVYEVDRIQHMYDEARKLRHDIKHCIVSANYHIDHKEYQEAKQFLNTFMEEKVDVMGYVKYCNNSVVNYILNDKFEKCKKNNIETKCIVNGEINTLSDIDLSILLGNLLDNAIEAAMQTDPARINVEWYVDDKINIIIENTIKDSLINNRNAFVTTKLDKKNHGLGMQSIRDIVKKYNGTIHYEEENDMMVCKVVIHK